MCHFSSLLIPPKLFYLLDFYCLFLKKTQGKNENFEKNISSTLKKLEGMKQGMIKKQGNDSNPTEKNNFIICQ